MRAYTLRDEKIIRVGIKNIPKKGLVWIRCTRLDEESVSKLSELSKIPLAELKETFEEDERPKLSVKKYLELIYHVPHKDNGELMTAPLYFYLSENLIITVEKEKSQILNNLEESMKKNRLKFLFKKPCGYFLYYIIDKINDEFLINIDRTTENLDIFKRSSEHTQVNFKQLYELSVTSAFFNRALIANIEVLNSLRKTYFKHLTSSDRELYSELYFDALQILDTEKIQREMISNIFNLESIMSQNRLNLLIKRLTSIALIIMIPTLITGIYGMNVRNMPLADSEAGFFMIMSFMFLITVFLAVLFKVLDWI
ncbi:hypothetical protein D6745_05465 [Candidatus Woesearchaeota archaeon]|nr:MAG: hypothetical protein D6745_05465 [Candidatus Woesearchaeota archaeon]